MKKNIRCNQTISFFPLLIISFVSVFLVSCSEDKNQSDVGSELADPIITLEPEPSTADQTEPEPAPTPEPVLIVEENTFPPPNAGKPLPTQKTKNTLDKYSVVLAASQQIKLPGLPGELRVWIGSPDFKPSMPASMTQDETTIAAVGETAKIKPHAVGFKEDELKSRCITIDPTGSIERFKLIPMQSGTFEVSANIDLYRSTDCSGSPIPKISTTLQVVVEVDKTALILVKLEEFWNVFWEELLDFWAALVALIFALFLFLIKNKLKKWFGFENK